MNEANKLNFAPASQRYKLLQTCFCGKSNKDGKCVPDVNNPEYGYCHSCNKSFFPDTEKTEFVPKIEPKKTDFIDSDLMQKSLVGYDKNNFFQPIKKIYPEIDIEARAKQSGIGSAKLWSGATIFFQIDQDGKVRSGKIMLYDPETMKRVKEPFSHFNWLHSVLKLKEFNLSQCLFGLHLVKGNTKPIAIVESEKTAFLMGLEDDSYLWLATGGKGNFTYEMLEPIKDRKIVAFPDKGEYQYWFDISQRLKEYGFDITVSPAIEKGNYPTGTDLADLLIEEKRNNPQINREATEIPPTLENEKQPRSNRDNTSFAPEIEGIKTGLTFDQTDLLKLAECIIPENDSITAKQLIDGLLKLEGLEQKDATDLILVMRIKNIIDKTTQGSYFLFNSTPY